MPVSRGRRVLLLSTAIAISAGAAGAAAFGDSNDNRTASPPPDFPSLDGGRWEWSFSSGDHGSFSSGDHTSFSSGDHDVIQVRARRCPKGHPHRVGSFSYTTTKIVDDKVQTRTSKGSFCAK
jgi:hypothetical protein